MVVFVVGEWLHSDATDEIGNIGHSRFVGEKIEFTFLHLLASPSLLFIVPFFSSLPFFLFFTLAAL